MMASENERLIREGYAAINRRDLDWMRAHAHPDFEFKSRFSGLSGRTYTGQRAFEQWLADIGETWESNEQFPERFVELDSERTAVEIRFKGRGRGSGVEVDQRIGLIFTIRDGKAVHVEAYDSFEDALAASQ
jgi:ketosteroid isomerase-like protein